MAWFPLESNPDVMNKLLQKLGIPNKWHIVDVYGLDSDIMPLIPKPVLSVILLFPRSEAYFDHSVQESKAIKEHGQILSPDIFFLKQVASNAGGTVALIHSIANNIDRIKLIDGTKFKQLLESSKNLSPEDRGQLLQITFAQIMLAHQEVALEGQTELKRDETVNHHYITFIHKDGYLYELDGRKEFPINHGKSSSETLLVDAVHVCKQFMERQPGGINFTLLAMVGVDT